MLLPQQSFVGCTVLLSHDVHPSLSTSGCSVLAMGAKEKLLRVKDPIHLGAHQGVPLCIRRWSPGAGVPRRSLLRCEDPRRPGIVRRFPGRRPAPFRSMLLFVLAFLRQT